MSLEDAARGQQSGTNVLDGGPTVGRPAGAEEHRMRAMLLQSEKLAALGQLVAGVSHEINNPLTGILGYAELLLRRGDLPAEVRTVLERIKKEAQRCGGLVRNMLSFAREHEPVWGPVNLHDVLRATLDLLAYRLRATNVQVIEEYLPDLPVVHGDANQLQQVFLNLIVNAQQALEGQAERTIVIRTGTAGESNTDGRAERRMVRVVVSDTGPGIPSAFLSRIFDPFFTTKEPGKGTGLGLSVSYGIVATHQGRLYVESTEGGGASFFVDLPATAMSHIHARGGGR